jgi:ligand-binding SRPBCC domain-containing protein
MGAITPPPIQVEVHRAPSELSDGDEMDFSLHLGPFRIHWLALIENASQAGFTDRQLLGPFQKWSHNHSFIQIKEDVTEVNDQVIAQVKKALGGRLFGWAMWLGIPFLFSYRGWKTRVLLEK